MSFTAALLVSLLPALLAIGAALVTRRVVPSLGLGVVVGAIVANAAPGAITGPGDVPREIVLATGRVVAGLYRYVADAVIPGLGSFASIEDWDWSHLVITAFSILVAATIGMLGASGTTRALVAQVERVARGRRGAMVASWLSGVIVFFDDYANCLVVGGAMGPLYDRFKVSRAKLAYIVDSTAAPIASLAVVSTWVGYEVGLISDQLAKSEVDWPAFSLFLDAIPYRFYGIFTIAFVGTIAISGRDFGPMRAAEQVSLDAPVRHAAASEAAHVGRWWAAAAPVLTLVFGTGAYMVWDGVTKLYPAKVDAFLGAWSSLVALPVVGLDDVFAADAAVPVAEALAWPATTGAPLFEILGSADPFWSMFWGSVAGFTLAVALAVAIRFPARDLPRGAWQGASPVLEAIVILYLAWALGNAMGETGAQGMLGQVISENISPMWLPALTFLLAAGTAFATGTSFGTMGILIPLVLGTCLKLTGGVIDGAAVLQWTDAAGAAQLLEFDAGSIVYGSVAAVLAGACLGDHASPISDTTVLSALGSGVDVVTHVRTQLPYALSAGFISLAVGYVPAGWGVSPWLTLPLGVAVSIAWVVILGRVPVTAPTGTRTADPAR